MYFTLALLSVVGLVLLYRKIRVKKEDKRFYNLLSKFHALSSYYPLIGNAHLLYGKLDSK